jgi:aspartyl-tRNA(Asn)/glutamyl-tRNA(Gln) amidotransferase subunit C
MDKEEVKKIAALARLEISDEEADSLAQEIDSILAYVKQVEDMSSSSEQDLHLPKNVMREDVSAHPALQYTEAILSNAPSSEKSFIKVKKIM